jgi:beta-mannosidase
MNKYLVFIFLIISTASFSQTVRKISLNDGWEFRQVGTEKWYPAVVPGCVHTDLYRNGLIPDPYFGSNEKDLQWIETKDWEYRKTFNLDENFIKENLIQITFEGLDTYADVYLNDGDNYFCYNMFQKFELSNIKNNLKNGINTLKIIFHSSVKKSDSLSIPYYKKNGIKGLPGGNQVFTRKAAYQFGWDFAPRYATCGIWKDVYIETCSIIKIENIQSNVLKLEEEEAVIDFEAKFKIQPGTGQGIKTFLLTDEDEKFVYDSTNSKSDILTYDTEGGRCFNGSFLAKIYSPKLWWCNGMGEPYLYTFKLIVKLNGKKIDERIIKAGLRKIELVQEKDNYGESFYFKLNGKPVFIKGANYVPADVFPSMISKDKYSNLITSAQKSNMNMLRVWGGGIYEDNYFYDLCDSLGIMVWQDFMFACGMYPISNNENFGVFYEVIFNYKRLCNHPCIALWCGNNEIDEGWKNWGWQKEFGYMAKDSINIWNDYVILFEKAIPEYLSYNKTEVNLDSAEYETAKPFIEPIYIPTSPKIGWGHPEAMTEGDSHYWGVWWGEEPFEMFKTKVPRFMSEYGFQSLPDIKTIESFTNPEDRNLNSEAMKSHQKHQKGFQLINEYMQRDFNVPENFEDYIQASQKLQTYGYKMAIEAQRRAKPYCMGTMFWQLNDCWPSVSWSAIDYYGRWKDIMYKLKDLYADILVSPVVENDSLKVYIVSDRLETSRGSLILALINDVTGDTLWTNDIQVSLPDNSSSVYFNSDVNSLIKNNNKDELYFSCRYINAGDNRTYTNKMIFVKPKYYKGKF